MNTRFTKTGEGWMYLAIVMDLYSRGTVGWYIDQRMTTDLVSKVLIKAYNLMTGYSKLLSPQENI